MTTDQPVAVDGADDLSVQPESILRLMLALRSAPQEAAFEQAGSLLWDLASGAPEAAFMVKNSMLDILEELLPGMLEAEQGRAVELCMGLAANLAAHGAGQQALLAGPAAAGLAALAVDGVLLCCQHPGALAECCRLLAAACAGEPHGTWRRQLCKEAAPLQQLAFIATNTLDPLLLERAWQLAAALLASEPADPEPDAPPTAGPAATGAADGPPTPPPAARLLAASIVAPLEDALRAAARQHGAPPPGAPPDQAAGGGAGAAADQGAAAGGSGGWSDDDEQGLGSGGTPAAAAPQDAVPCSEAAAAAALASLEQLASSREVQQALAAPGGALAHSLLCLLGSQAAVVQEAALVAAVACWQPLLPQLTQPAALLLLAQALVDCGAGSEDAADAAWYLLSVALRGVARPDAGEPAGGGEQGGPGSGAVAGARLAALAGALRHAAALLPSAPLPDSSRVYAAAVCRQLRDLCAAAAADKGGSPGVAGRGGSGGHSAPGEGSAPSAWASIQQAADQLHTRAEGLS